MDTGMVGKFVIVRCHDAGVHAGTLEAVEGRQALLTNARRLWYWKPAAGLKFLNGVALAGLASGSKIGGTVEKILLTENCEVILCTAEAASSIMGITPDE